MRYPAKLIGGAFDGDEGTVRATSLPHILWVFACPAGPFCASGGVHWATEKKEAPRNALRYLYEDLEPETGVAIYVWSEIGPTQVLMPEKELVTA